MDLVLENCKFVGGDDGYHIGIKEGKIEKISKTKIKGEKIIDIKDKIVFPGLIDPHVHFRDPGFPQKEDFKSGSMAAANGGFTTVFDMPNTKPLTNTYKAFKEKLKIAKRKSIVDFRLYSGINTLDELKKIAELNPIGFKMFVDSLNEEEIEKTFQNIKSINSEYEKKEKKEKNGKQGKSFKLALHCENKDIIEESTAHIKKLKCINGNSAIDYSFARNSNSEVVSINQAIELSKKYEVPIHICHLSTIEGLKSVMQCKNKINNENKKSFVTTEVTPHHLLLTNQALDKYGTMAKTNPPLRPNGENLTINDLKNIDMIGSDHAPHTIADKNKGLWDSAPGIPGLETTLPLLISELKKRNMSLKLIQEKLSENPAKIFNLENKGEIAIGKDADFSIVDYKKEGKINLEEFYTKAKYSPFEGYNYTGKGIMTIFNGKIIMEEGNVFNS
ncbi:MAG: dihydroorotase family protein [Methanobrevibacter sp.]|nr:dihydroorotase family protein [Methanobrevibacter sp.]